MFILILLKYLLYRKDVFLISKSPPHVDTPHIDLLSPLQSWTETYNRFLYPLLNFHLRPFINSPLLDLIHTVDWVFPTCDWADVDGCGWSVGVRSLLVDRV
jgi:hypothetical protein